MLRLRPDNSIFLSVPLQMPSLEFNLYTWFWRTGPKEYTVYGKFVAGCFYSVGSASLQAMRKTSPLQGGGGQRPWEPLLSYKNM